jgi:chorismate synthase
MHLFGQSYGPAVGAVLEILPLGMKVDQPFIDLQLKRRQPGQSLLTTQRKEDEQVEWLSGLKDGTTTGYPLAFVIRNRDTESQKYESFSRTPRPGHGDFTQLAKFGSTVDLRGAGHISGRLTAPMVVAGALARQHLEAKGWRFAAHTVQIGHVKAPRYGEAVEELKVAKLDASGIASRVEANEVRCVTPSKASQMKEVVLLARKELDSVGGVIECAVEGVPAGIGEPLLGAVEGRIAEMMLAVPAVKGIEFGAGFGAASMRGSHHNDVFMLDNGKVVTKTNHAGGVLGGITTGMPIVFRVVVKPASSIAKEQDTIDVEAKKPAKLSVQGRHDPCIVIRAVPVIENCVAIALYDLVLEARARGQAV